MVNPNNNTDTAYSNAPVEKKDITSLIDIVERSQEKNVVADAIYKLGVQQVGQAVGLLIFQALRGKWAKVRQAAVVALGEIGNPIAVKPLTMMLNKQDETKEGDPPYIDDYLGKAALQALGKIGKRGNQEAIRNIVQALDSPWSVAALQVLNGIGEPAAAILADSLKNGDESIQRLSIRALGQIGSKSSTSALLAALGEVSSSNLSIAEEIIKTLGRIKDPEAVGPLVKIMKVSTTHDNADYGLQCFTIIALGEIRDKRATDTLIQLVLHNDETRIRSTAATALGMIGDEKAITPLIRIIENEREDEVIKESVAWALSQLDETRVAIPLIRYLKKYHKSFLTPMIIFESDAANVTQSDNS